MHPLYEQLQNPLTYERNAHDRAEVKKLFPELSSWPGSHCLALRRYVSNCPERFFDRTVCEYFLEWLKNQDTANSHRLQAYLNRHLADANRALLFLREINSQSWHDELPKGGDDYDLIRFIDHHIHPTYLRLIEAVLVPLVRIVAYFSRLDRGKGTDGLDVWSTVQELSKSSTAFLVAPYHHIVRNGIAHGGITYLQNEIRYRDKKGNEETFSSSSIIRLCDDLLDTSNGLAAALKVFLILRKQQGYTMPQELLLEELQEETQTPWWKIEGCVQSEIGSQKQLLVYARPDSRDYGKIEMSTIQSGILAEFFAPGYDRYFFSLRSPKALPGWAAFDGKKLEMLRLNGTSDITQYSGIVENDLVFYMPRPALPRILRKLDTLVHSFRLNSSRVMAQQRQKLGIPHVVSRNATIHQNSWGCVLNGAVFIEDLTNELAVELVHKWRRRIVNTALKTARRTVGLPIVARYLPLGFARVAVFRRDYRRRRLASFGLAEDLVCTIQFQRLRRIRSPDIWGATVEASGKWRIAWNKAWLKATGQKIDALDGYSAGAP